jgi:hypothetical protein
MQTEMKGAAVQAPEQHLAAPVQSLRPLMQSAQVPEELMGDNPSQLPEQQSVGLEQVPPLAVQAATAMQVPPAQFPEQHWPPVVQAFPLAVQAGGVTQAPLTQFWPAPQQTPPSQHVWVVGQQVVPPGQKAWPLGHWQLALVQAVPPVQTLPQAAQFSTVPSEVQVPLQQPVPSVQQVTWSECCEAQTFCVLPPHCLQALLQLDRCGRGRVLQ